MAELKINFEKMAEGFIKIAKEKGMFVGWWIPVSERLPKENGCYLVTIQAFGQQFMKVVSFAINLSLIDKYDFKGKEQSGWYGCDSEYGYYEMNDVIAWMPLPEPYKESEGKE